MGATLSGNTFKTAVITSLIVIGVKRTIVKRSKNMGIKDSTKK
jgi:hypothetical protein